MVKSPALPYSGANPGLNPQNVHYYILYILQSITRIVPNKQFVRKSYAYKNDAISRNSLRFPSGTCVHLSSCKIKSETLISFFFITNFFIFYAVIKYKEG